MHFLFQLRLQMFDNDKSCEADELAVLTLPEESIVGDRFTQRLTYTPQSSSRTHRVGLRRQ